MPPVYDVILDGELTNVVMTIDTVSDLSIVRRDESPPVDPPPPPIDPPPPPPIDLPLNVWRLRDWPAVDHPTPALGYSFEHSGDDSSPMNQLAYIDHRSRQRNATNDGQSFDAFLTVHDGMIVAHGDDCTGPNQPDGFHIARNHNDRFYICENGTVGGVPDPRPHLHLAPMNTEYSVAAIMPAFIVDGPFQLLFDAGIFRYGRNWWEIVVQPWHDPQEPTSVGPNLLSHIDGLPDLMGAAPGSFMVTLGRDQHQNHFSINEFGDRGQLINGNPKPHEGYDLTDTIISMTPAGVIDPTRRERWLTQLDETAFLSHYLIPHGYDEENKIIAREHQLLLDPNQRWIVTILAVEYRPGKTAGLQRRMWPGVTGRNTSWDISGIECRGNISPLTITRPLPQPHTNGDLVTWIDLEQSDEIELSRPTQRAGWLFFWGYGDDIEYTFDDGFTWNRATYAAHNPSVMADAGNRGRPYAISLPTMVRRLRFRSSSRERWLYNFHWMEE